LPKQPTLAIFRFHSAKLFFSSPLEWYTMDFIYFCLIDVSRIQKIQDLAIKIRLKCFFFRFLYLFFVQFFVLLRDIHHSLSNREIFVCFCLLGDKALSSIIYPSRESWMELGRWEENEVKPEKRTFV
jgi:hypothetical protein